MTTQLEFESPTASAKSLRVVVIHDEAQLAPWADQWNVLAAGIPFRTSDWMLTWWRHYRDHASRLFTLLVVDPDDQLVAIAPWYIRRSGRGGNVVQFLGSGEVCSDYLTIPCRDDVVRQASEAIADWLSCEAVGAWHLLDLSGIETSDEAIGHLLRRFAELGHPTHTQADQSCWRTELPRTWDGFLATFSKSRREKTRTLLRRSIDSGRVVLHRVSTETDFERAFDVFIDLHQKRRRSLNQAGCFSSQRFTDFHRDVARRALATAQLRMMWTELDGRPLAVSYSFVDAETIYYYQGGFDPELADERPGYLSFAIDFRLAIQEGYRAYDFLRGDESYKASWQAVSRPLARVRIVGRQPSARVRHATWRSTQFVKRVARKVLSRVKDSN